MYKLVVTELADGDLDNIVAYITGQLANPTAVRRFLDEIESCYTNLKRSPLMYELARDGRLAAKGYRRVIIGSYIMLYMVDKVKMTVTVYRYFYGPRDYTKLI
jgi:plasmid stabilization system protein ParE